MSQIKAFNGYKIREATLEDILTLIHMRKAIFTETMSVKNDALLDNMDEAYMEYLRETMQSEILKAWLVEATDGSVVAGGSVLIHHWPPLPYDFTLRQAHIHSVYTKPEHRRRGLAKAVLLTILEWCRENRFRIVALHAEPESRKLFESLGFKPTTEMRLYL